MRISTSSIYEAGIASMQSQTEKLLTIQQQLASGRRMLTPADDPVAAARALEISQSQSINKQFGVNNGTANDSLRLEESALGSINGLLQEIRELAVKAGNPILDRNNRASLATELRGRYQDLLSLANSTDGNGQYMFSGYQGGVKPFAEAGPGVVNYLGDQGRRLVQVSPTRQVEVSNAGSDIFQSIKSGNGNFVTAANAGNTGTGIVDSGVVLNQSSWNALANNKNFTIRFAGTAQAIPAATNTPGGATSTAAIVNQTLWNASSKDYSVVFTSATQYNIVDNKTATNIVSGASYTSGAPINIQGATTIITDGAGPVTPQAGDRFNIMPPPTPGATYDIVDNVSGNSLLTGLAPGNPPYGRAFSTTGSINLKSQGSEPAFDFGALFNIGGMPNGGDSFTVLPSQQQDMFTIINDLANLIDSSTTGTAMSNLLSGIQQNVDNAMQNTSNIRASTGTRLKELDTVADTVDNKDLQYSETLSRLQDIDYAKVISELTMQQANLEAAQKSFSRVSGLSLFNYL